MLRNLSALLAFFPLIACGGDFIRVTDDPAAARLQTAVTRYENHGVTVDLLGAVHIADQAYYQQLTTRFKTYDALLFEMIGGENLGRQPTTTTSPTTAEGKEKKDEKLNGLRTIYDSAARYLELSGQVDEIDYHAPNFVHADLTLREFRAKMKERKESILSFALSADQSKVKQPDSLRLIRAILAGSANHVKREIVKTLGSGDDQVSSIAGENVVISDRNARCMEVLQSEIKAGRKNLGIFYGAAHFPDMEKRLAALGFRRVSQEWLTAWNMPKKVALKKAG